MPITASMATSTRSKTSSSTRKNTAASHKFESRAVTRDVEAGSTVDCAHCDERVKFQAKVRNKQVICNVYINGRWNRVDHYHADCYVAAGSPYGEPAPAPDRRRARAAAAKKSEK